MVKGSHIYISPFTADHYSKIESDAGERATNEEH